MTDDLLKSKIELLQLQIANLENSGFFTETEMKKYSVFYRAALAMLQNQLAQSNLAKSTLKTTENIIEFSNTIQVIDAQILTPNQQPA